MSKGEKLLTIAQSGNVTSFMEFISTHYNDSDWKNTSHKKSGDSLLNYAARNGALQLLKFLQQQRMDLELANFDGKNALHEACQAGHLECVQYLLAQNIDLDCLKRADWLVTWNTEYNKQILSRLCVC